MMSGKLGRLDLSIEGCKQRDIDAFSAFAKAKTKSGQHIPVQCSMGGGYSPEIKTIIEAHANTFRVAREYAS